MWRAATRSKRGPENKKINPYFSDQINADQSISPRDFKFTRIILQ